MSREQFRKVLIIGFPRSGTTLLREVLSRHSRVRAVDHEPHFVYRLLKRFERSPLDKSEAIEFLQDDPSFPSHRIDSNELYGVQDETIARLLSKTFALLSEGSTSSEVIALKLPRLVYRLEAWKELFPASRVIHIIRDPRGVIASNLARWPSTSPWTFITRWKRAIRVGQEWGRSNPNSYNELKFEDLLREPENQLQSLCTRLDLEYEPNMLNLSYVLAQWNADEPGSPKSRHFSTFDESKIDQWVQTLSTLDIQLVETCCVRELQRLGYRNKSRSVNPLRLGGYAFWHWGRHHLSKLTRVMSGGTLA